VSSNLLITAVISFTFLKRRSLLDWCTTQLALILVRFAPACLYGTEIRFLHILSKHDTLSKELLILWRLVQERTGFILLVFLNLRNGLDLSSQHLDLALKVRDITCTNFRRTGFEAHSLLAAFVDDLIGEIRKETTMAAGSPLKVELAYGQLTNALAYVRSSSISTLGHESIAYERCHGSDSRCSRCSFIWLHW
jgi:hypothetical protein